MSDSSFLARSRSAFLDYFPNIAKRLVAVRGANSSIVVEDGEPVDIRVEGQLTYGGDARLFASRQVEAFMQKPLRFSVQRLDLSGIVTDVGCRLINTIEKGLRVDAYGQCTAQAAKSPTFLIVFGLGLGHHLQELARRTEARWLILVEPFFEFFEPSFHAVDWAALIEEFKERGGEIRIITDMDPQGMISIISGFVNSKGAPYTDGSWVFTHYPFWAFAEARNHLHEVMEYAFINRGFYEDELVMMRNTVDNFARHRFSLLEERPRLRRAETVVVVGAGPSLDESIETIRRIRDRVVLFSAGTALRALLTNGIVPDFQCELENVPGVYDVLGETAKIDDISGIRLLASSTVDPRVPTLFRDIIFYFRDSVSATQILGRKHRELFGTGPTCVNLAVVAAVAMGFTDFVLFGTDCGTRPGRSRHAKGTVYTDIGIYAAGNKALKDAMIVDGNFGGVVSTDIVYDACRTMLADAIKFYGLNVVNCSDGALIPGALPRVPEALEIAAPPIDRAQFEAEIDRAMRSYAPGELLTEADFASIKTKTEEMFGALDTLLAELGKGDADFAVAYDRVMAFVRDAKDRYGRTESIISGSLQALPRIAMFYGFRVASSEGRRKLFDLFIAEFRAILADMAQTIDTLFAGLETAAPVARRAANGG